MATYFRCDNCGKEAKHGDEWMHVSIRQRSIRLSTYQEMEPEGSVFASYHSEGVLVCSAPCAIRMIVKQAGQLQDFANQWLNVEEDEVANENRSKS